MSKNGESMLRNIKEQSLKDKSLRENKINVTFFTNTKILVENWTRTLY